MVTESHAGRNRLIGSGSWNDRLRHGENHCEKAEGVLLARADVTVADIVLNSPDVELAASVSREVSCHFSAHDIRLNMTLA